MSSSRANRWSTTRSTVNPNKPVSIALDEIAEGKIAYHRTRGRHQVTRITTVCGIVGYIGQRDSVPIILDSLGRLEYRGYDSAGIAVIDSNGDPDAARRPRGSSRVWPSGSRTASACRAASASATRAGRRTAVPRTPTRIRTWTAAGKIAVIHNGIIENYASLRARLIDARSRLQKRDRYRGSRASDRDCTTTAISKRPCARRLPRYAALTRWACSPATIRIT